jgi:hypothetical protein
MRKAFVTVLIASALPSHAFAAELLTNGNFETGNLSGWTVIDQAGGDGTWTAVGNGAPSASNGFPTPAFAGGGNFNAQTDQQGPGSHQLTQSFSAIAGGTYVLNFDAYARDLTGFAPTGSGLDFSTAALNQHVEIGLSGGASPIFSGTFTEDWAHYTFDLSPFITSSGPYTLSFGEVDNVGPYNVGLDNVSLTAREAGAVPEPKIWATMLLGFAMLAGAMRRRQSVSVRYR